MFTRNARLGVATLFLGLLVGEARGHFLFVRIGPMAEGGRSAEVFFSEQAEAGDPLFVPKVAHTKLWKQTKPGEFSPMIVRTAPDRLRAIAPASGSVSAVGVCEYGVLSRSGKSFLLRYYPKAVAGVPKEINGFQPKAEIPFEISATFEGDSVSFSVLSEGKPTPGAKFTTIDADLANDVLTASADGKASWKPKHPGRFSIYTSRVVPTKGDLAGKPYDEVREFATLAFTWPLVRSGADEEAVSIFEQAVAKRAQWKDFPGFTASIAGNVDGRSFGGTIAVDSAGAVKVDTDDESTKKWVKDQLDSMVLHRLPEPGDRERPTLRFADQDEEHPLGRLLEFVGGQFASSYRVKDGRISTVNRHVGASNFSIVTLDEEKNADGLYLPRGYVVQYWDAATGELKRTETVRDRWVRVGRIDLPESHVVTSAGDSGLSVKGFSLHEIKTAK